MIKFEGQSCRSGWQKVAFCVSVFFLATTIFLSLPFLAHSADNFYYIQVGSFKTEQKAAQFSNELRQLEYDTVIRYTEISAAEFWNRVYIGPYSSRGEVDSAALELRKKGVFTGQAIIIGQPAILEDKFQEKPEPIIAEQQVAVAPEEEAEAITASADEGKLAPAEDAMIAATATAEATETKQLETTAPSPSVTSSSTEIKLKGLNKGFGRNIRGRSISLGLKQSYIEMDTELTQRVRVTDSGNTQVPITEDIKYGFPSSYWATVLQARFGLTDFVELYADLGFNYDLILLNPGIFMG